jgi:uncharacterized protein YbjQ (UPF0145 family)
MLYLFIGVLGLIGFINLYKKNKAVASAVSLDLVLNQKRKEIVVVSTPTVPSKNIKSVIGVVSGKSKTGASSPQEIDLTEKEAMLAIIDSAQGLGANAVVDLKATSSSYQEQGSKWQVTQTMYTGTAVVIE